LQLPITQWEGGNSITPLPFAVADPKNFSLRPGCGEFQRHSLAFAIIFQKMPSKRLLLVMEKKLLHFYKQLRMVKVFVFEQKLKIWRRSLFMPQLSATRRRENFGLTGLRIPS
jgi:hypothetical protein